MELDLEWIARATASSKALREERVQGLWSGYGEVVRVALEGDSARTVVVKWVRPPARANDASHERKCRSYAVEAAWYGGVASRCDATCRVPRKEAIRSGPGRAEWLFVLEDLDAAGFDRRTHRPSPAELASCLAWLASFHARFVGVEGASIAGLWKTGTYWHLATRRDELAAIDDADLRDAAPLLDRALARCQHQTLVHGDAKPANFCFSRTGDVAAVDFQYVGGGCGMKDVAYLVDGADATQEARLLDVYFGALRDALAPREDVDAAALEDEWRRLYPIASADYLRFLAGWAKEHFRRDRRARERVASVLRTL
jgi:hypothetical protein